LRLPGAQIETPTIHGQQIKWWHLGPWFDGHLDAPPAVSDYMPISIFWVSGSILLQTPYSGNPMIS
jgi:hypothetical protein